MAAGALVAMPLTGQVLDRRAERGVTRAATLLYCLICRCRCRAQRGALGAILFVFGAANGAMDVADERARRGRRARTRPPDHVLAARRLEPRRLRAAGLAVLTGAAGIDPRVWALGVGIALGCVSL